MKLIDKIFGTYSERQIKRIRPLADGVEALAEKYAAMSDEELRGQTAVYDIRKHNKSKTKSTYLA